MFNFFKNNVIRRTSDHTIDLDKINITRSRTIKADLIPLFVIPMILLCTSFLMMYSSGGKNLVITHGQKVIIALILFIICTHINTHMIRWISWPIYFATLILLIYVSVFGHIGKGAQRWISLAGFHFEPSEIMKLFLPIVLINMIDSHQSFDLKLLAKVCLAIFPPAILILKQPDLGTATVVLLIGATTLFFAGIPRRWMTVTFALLLLSLPVFWSLMHDYQKMRILNLFNSHFDPQNTGYHIHQSIIAIGSGGFWGKGFAHGSQVQLSFLPEHTTDFIFAHIAEEFGLIGCCFIISCYIYLTIHLFLVAHRCKDFWSKCIVQAVAVYLSLAAIINMGMVSGLLPVVGVPLPFISRGGSHLLLSLCALAFTIVCIKHNKQIRIFKHNIIDS